MGDGPQADALGRDRLLPSNVRGSHDRSQAEKAGGAEFVIFDDCLKRAAIATVIQLYCPDLGRIERNRMFSLSTLQQLAFFYEQKLCIGINEAADQPGARDTIDLNILSGDPLHGILQISASGGGAELALDENEGGRRL
jgi:hypothetical protein